MIASTYQIIEQIGAGGGGRVYLADHLRLGKKVVLKADKRSITSSPDLLRREVDVLKNLSHSNIPQVYDFFAEDGTVYTVMEYIEGESLDRALKRGERFSQPQVVAWARQLLEALCYLHSPTHGDPPRGYVHSDIKPANLMRRPDGRICLIDFNIALALGEESVVGCSVGYASPEHYGIDLSSDSGFDTQKLTAAPDGQGMDLTVTMPAGKAAGKGRRVLPDARSDIYSVGATLYHLLSGTRPAKDAQEVAPLSGKEYSPQIVDIITKAMQPNPDLRYQSAKEMLDAFEGLHRNDPRVRRFQRQRLAVSAALSATAALGAAAAFLGLWRMRLTEQSLKLAEYAQNALAEGDRQKAVSLALQALPQRDRAWNPDTPPQVQCALAEALGVYDLSDGFRAYRTLELPAAPVSLELAPDGGYACAVCADSAENTFAAVLFDTETAAIEASLPAADSALAEAEFLDGNTLVYAGREGVCAYDIADRQELWTGGPATAVSISADGSRVAALYRDDSFATVYDAGSGEVTDTVDFEGSYQGAAANDSFANPDDHILALNEDGSRLAVSFEDGSLWIYDLEQPERSVMLLDQSRASTHFEGGFYGPYFAFSAAGAQGSVFAVVDTTDMEQTGGFESEDAFGVQADADGICVQSGNLLVTIDPVTGEQTPLVTTAETIDAFSWDGSRTEISGGNAFSFFGGNAGLLSRFETEFRYRLLCLEGDTALAAGGDTADVRILRFEGHPEAEICAYDPSYIHDEARLGADGQTVMLFSYRGFRVQTTAGETVAEVELPDADQVYDQQFVREGDEACLQVIYRDGTVRTYDARDGSMLSEETGERPDDTLLEEFETDRLRVESPLHGTPQVYDAVSGKRIGTLAEDAYLTYVTQTGAYIVAQYVTVEGECYGQLLNEDCEVLAELPCLCDVCDGRLVFDYPTGDLRSAEICGWEELLELARTEQ